MAKRGKKEKIKTGHLSDVPVLDNLGKKNMLLNIFKLAITPQELLDLDEWSDKFRYLPQETSSEWGRWATSRFPFLRRIMKCLSPSSKASEIIAIKGCQLGFTEICICWILYIVDRCPGPTMYVQKTCDAGEEFGSQKLVPNIDVCDKVYDKIGEGAPARYKNTSSEKGFPGGYLALGGANSGPFLRSKSIANMMADEEDSFKLTIDGEGSPIGMMRMRQNNFPNSKFFRLSTPKYTETSTIWRDFLVGSEEYFYVPCPHCNEKAERYGTYFIINWDNMRYSEERNDNGDPREVYLICTECGCEIQETKKTWMLEHGIWMSTKNWDNYDEPLPPYEVGDVGKPSFQISSLYSPPGFKSWGSCVQDFWRWKDTGDRALYQTFKNQILGETYDAAGQDIDYSWLMERKEEYGAQIPEGVLCLTSGWDVQPDRLEGEILGHGLDGETWSIDYVTIWGNTNDLGDSNGLDGRGRPTVWKLLDDYLFADYYSADGTFLNIECTFIDAGYDTATVHNYCRFRLRNRIYPTKGLSGWGKGYIERTKRVHDEYKTIHPKVYVDEMKKHTYESLRVDTKGRGYCHFPNNEHYGKKYFAGLVAETLKTVNNVLKWECPQGVRNEPLDCRNYAQGAFFFYSPNMLARAHALRESFEEQIMPTQVLNDPRSILPPPTNKVMGGRGPKQVVRRRKGPVAKVHSRGV